ncbi:MAG: FHA domain-containing protein [Anaerolineae bacterium]|nr:FHA domain-containing protein [Anaerolineae bacterium]
MGIQSPVLSICPNQGQWSSRVLKPGKWIIGRSSHADISLEDASLSREHCSIEIAPEAVFLTDLGSANGTFVNNTALAPFQPLALASGQMFRIGMHHARIDWCVSPGSPEDPIVESTDLAVDDMSTGGAGEANQPGRQDVLPAQNHAELILQYHHGNGVWEEICLLPGETIIGRAEDADLRLYDPQVSRRHARLTLAENGTATVMDLGSANGTQLDGEPLKPRDMVPFQAGQLLMIAGCRLRIDNRTAPLNLSAPDLPAEEPCAESTSLAVSRPVETGLLLRYRKVDQPWCELPLADGRYQIGRSEEVEIQLDSHMVSRKHAEIRVETGQVWVTDLNSRNGILVAGTRLGANVPKSVCLTERFSIGEFVFELCEGLMPAQAVPSAIGLPEDQVPVEKTVIGSQMGIDLAAMFADSAPAPVNLAGHDRVTIGRASDNMIRFDHPLVSRYHAVIERMGTRTRITDLHSANGIYLNGGIVEGQGWLKQGDLIKIGPYLITFTGNELRPSSEQSYTIDVVGLQKWVAREVNLLKEISLNIGQNEFVALVGMSGAGKSTLMDAINGFRPATDGKVYINGLDLYQNYNQFRDEIGNVPQRDIVHMELTAEQALSYAAELRMPPDASEEDRQRAVADTLEDLGLTYRKDLQISRLSGGQIKRVSIGVELLTKPRLFFLDEPTSGLDPGTEYEMMKLLRRLADQGRTIMLITHATKNVMFCDKTIILANGGHLAFYGPPEDALVYFDQFRNHRERLEKEMEFDDIYRILEDPERGTPADWRERYLKSEYARYTISSGRVAAAAAELSAESGASRVAGQRISGARQLGILSRRYLRCMVQDKVSLILTLSLAPILGLMNFIWGSKLFDPVVGNAAKTMGVWFAVTVMGILVGYMGSIQELVKEKAIYKRERAVGLKITSYVLSKIWVGGALAFYQAFFILLFAVLLVKPLVTEPSGYVSMYFTLVLVIFNAFILGLVISALSENANTAQLIMIAAFVPQLLLAGVLQPLHMIVGGELISPIVEARWSFENFVNATGMGDPLVNDPCWSEYDRSQRNSLTNEQKDAQCVCMGAGLFKNCARIPGILSDDFYDAEAQLVLAMDRPQQPVAPERLPTPTPRSTPTTIASPTFMPSPTYLPTPTAWATLTPRPVCSQPGQGNCVQFQAQQEEAGRQMMEYQETRSAQFEDYRDDTEEQFQSYWENVGDQMEGYKVEINDQIDTFADEERDNVDAYAQENMDLFEGYQVEMETYSEDLSYYERSRQEAISSAEAIISILWDDYGSAFRGGVLPRMGYITAITVVQFIVLLVLMKRKDTV